MARSRVRAAARKAASAAAARERAGALPQQIAAGVLAVCRDVESLVKPGALYWLGPLQYVCEQMAPKVCAEHDLAQARRDDVAGYLMAGMQEYLVQLAGEFDVEHFERWIAAQDAQDQPAGQAAGG